MRYSIIILTIVLFTSCKGNKNISGAYSHTDFRGKITQSNQTDIEELYRSECSGTVINQNTTEGIPLATIILNNNIREYKANTDKVGKFKIKNIIGGNYQIKVLFIGFYPLIDSVNIEIGKSIEYKIELVTDSNFKLE